jgi:hypothetical protein
MLTVAITIMYKLPLAFGLMMINNEALELSMLNIHSGAG